MKKHIFLTVYILVIVSMFAACLGGKFPPRQTPYPTQTSHPAQTPQPTQGPNNPDQFDLSVNPKLYSVAADNYGAQANLTVQSGVALNGKALKVTIPDNTNYTTGYGDKKEVWSWLCVPLNDIYDEDYINLKNKYLTFSVKLQNSSQYLSTILIDNAGTFSTEYGIKLDDVIFSGFYSAKNIGDGWYKVYIKFSAVNEETFIQREYSEGTVFDITKCKTIMLTTSNWECNSQIDSTVYIDNMYLTDQVESGYKFAKPEIYPHNPDAATKTDILIIGNSFVYTTDICGIFQGIADENDKPLYVESYSKGGGQVYELYDMAIEHYTNNMSDTWGNKLFRGEYDILFLQAIFGNYDNGVQKFYNKLEELNLDTQIILLPADNEGTTAENLYLNNTDKYQLINWRQLVSTLKSQYGLTNWDLNQAADDWHANALSGYTASVAIYYYLYGEMPKNLAQTHQMLMDGYYVSYRFTTRGTQAEKLARFASIQTAAKNMIDSYY